MSAASQRRVPAPVPSATFERTGLVPDRSLTWQAGTGDRRLHDKVVAAMPVSPYIVGGTIADDAIRIRTAPADERRYSGSVIRFDDVVAPGGVRLNGAGMEHHLLTAKVLVNIGLMPGIGWCSSDLSIRGFYRSFTLMVRWMGANGIGRMAAIREEHFALFREQLASGGLEVLYPVLPSLDAFLARAADGKEVFPHYFDGAVATLSMDEMAHRLGLPRGRSLSQEATRRILEVAAEVAPELIKHRDAPAEKRVGTRAPGKGLTVQRVAEMLEPWERLHDLSRRLPHDRIGYRAFTPLATRDAVAKVMGRESGRTRDIPADVLGFLLDRAIRWLDYADYVRTLYDTARKARAREGFDYLDPAGRRTIVRSALSGAMLHAPVGPGAPSPMVPVYSTFWGNIRGFREAGLDLRMVLTRLLPGACFILIATFSARRKIELESLRQGCVVRDGDPWLLAWIGKTVREVDRIPVPESVARAVSILEWLSEDARNATGEAWLFSLEELTSGGMVINIDVDKAINEFAQFVGVDSLPNGAGMKLAAHQFRRAFAIIYFYRFRMPSLPALSFFLRHYDADMTVRYLSSLVAGSYMRILDEQDASEEERRAAKSVKADRVANARAFEEVAEEFLILVLTLAERGDEPMVGKAGEAIMLELHHYMKSAPRMVSVSGTGVDEGSMSLDQIIKWFVQNIMPLRLDHNPSGTSSCLCGPDPHRLGVANCLKRKAEREGAKAVAGARGPDFAYAEPGECGDCYNGVQLPEHQARLAEYVADQWKMAETAAAPPLRAAAARRAQKVEGFRQGFYGPGNGPARGEDE